MEFAFHIYNQYASDGVIMALNKLLKAEEKKEKEGAGMRSNAKTDVFSAPPVIVCVGSDLAIGDSLGPITGSMLKHKTQGLNAYVYGTLSAPITAKEIKYMRTFLKETHEGSPVIAIDAAVGSQGDIGLIKINNTPLLPGAGAKKQLGELGDISIMGIVAEKSIANYGLLNTTRLHLVYKMATILSEAISALFYNDKENKRIG